MYRKNSTEKASQPILNELNRGSGSFFRTIFSTIRDEMEETTDDNSRVFHCSIDA